MIEKRDPVFDTIPGTRLGGNSPADLSGRTLANPASLADKQSPDLRLDSLPSGCVFGDELCPSRCHWPARRTAKRVGLLHRPRSTNRGSSGTGDYRSRITEQRVGRHGVCHQFALETRTMADSGQCTVSCHRPPAESAISAGDDCTSLTHAKHSGIPGAQRDTKCHVPWIAPVSPSGFHYLESRNHRISRYHLFRCLPANHHGDRNRPLHAPIHPVKGSHVCSINVRVRS